MPDDERAREGKGVWLPGPNCLPTGVLLVLKLNFISTILPL
jgi:hypothetical protein